jgi:hypothetical protein
VVGVGAGVVVVVVLGAGTVVVGVVVVVVVLPPGVDPLTLGVLDPLPPEEPPWLTSGVAFLSV